MIIFNLLHPKTLKLCTHCHTVKNIGLFSIDKARPDGHTIWCKKCQSAYSKKRWKNNKEILSAIHKKKYWANPEAARSYARSMYYKNTDRSRKRARKTRLKTKYGLTTEQLDGMITTQNNKCKICERVMDKPYIDHDHTTGKIRDLLCNTCNRGIGLMQDNAIVLRKAAAYLEKHNAY